MGRGLAKLFVLFVFGCCCGCQLVAQPTDPTRERSNDPTRERSKTTRIWTVKDGLPQSYISGMVQDQDGFLWIATLNGFCRCDGRTFKYYHPSYTDSNSVGGNIILNLFDAGHNELLLCYLDGRIELFNTVTEKVLHLWKDKAFDELRPEVPFFKSLLVDHQGICWMMARDGGLIRIDLGRHLVKHFTRPELRLAEPVLGLALLHDSLNLLTKTQLSVLNPAGQPVRVVPYPFKTLETFRTGSANNYAPAVRKNGELIVPDSGGIRIWNPVSGFFKSISCAERKRPGKLVGWFDHAGNYYFEADGGINLLRPDNTVTSWSSPDPSTKGLITSLFVDRSNVLWAGTNGYGLRQYNILKTGLPGYDNQSSFVVDVLSHYTQPGRSFLDQSVAFANRCASFHDSIWVTDVNRIRTNPTLALFAGHTLAEITFHNEDHPSGDGPCRIIFLCFNQAGVLWGIDQHFSLLRFNLRQHSFRIVRSIGLDPAEELNGMAADRQGSFFITTTRNLVQVGPQPDPAILTALLPSKELLTVTCDREDDNILWIGTLSDGLIRFDKATHRTQLFNMRTGLPNNTVYGVLQGNDGQLWCSSNKGIFAFDKQLHTARSFTSRDGLIDDEFNRFYYINLPAGELAFGGPLGYTIFNPSNLETDKDDPPITLTGLEIINHPRQDSLWRTLGELRLRYDQNFISAEFTAMQFDFPEKLQYRYMLEGFDKDWIVTGNDNKAKYTNLPPGSYTLLMNASNTNGKWSRNIRRLRIVISPPFWRTTWFFILAALLLALIVYVFLHTRIGHLKKAHRQQLQFERKAMELQAMALRARMNPHFIFNCLNSIKALIQEQEDQKAITYLTTFVTLIRKQLTNPSDKISLQEELDTCRLYLRLEAMRFDGRIGYEFEIDENVQPHLVSVPSLFLQPVIENAVVHGLHPVEQGGLITIRIRREGRHVICSIEDNGIGRAAAAVHRQNSSRLHASRGVEMLEQRILIHNRLNEWAGSMETIDLYEPSGEAAGTRVILKFDAPL